MSLQETITQELHQAMKNKDRFKTGVLRLIKAALLDAQVKSTQGGKRKELNDDDIITIIDSMVKKCRESATLFRQGGSEEKAQTEEQEIALLQNFLPQRLNKEETMLAVQNAITKNHATSMKDMGAIMSHLQKEHGAQLDRALAALVTKDLLGGT